MLGQVLVCRKEHITAIGVAIEILVAFVLVCACTAIVSSEWECASRRDRQFQFCMGPQILTENFVHFPNFAKNHQKKRPSRQAHPKLEDAAQSRC